MCYTILLMYILLVFFFKQKAAYEMRISDWSSDVCSSDLLRKRLHERRAVDRVDRVEERHRLLGLVRLQLADQVQHDAGRFGAQIRPFSGGLLHAILAEMALTRRDQWADRRRIIRIRNRQPAAFASLALRALSRVGEQIGRAACGERVGSEVVRP